MLSRSVLTSNRQDWRTPDDILQRAKRALEVIDLDPCAGDGNPYADHHFTKRQDGLRQPWQGRVYLNPPYKEAKRWIKKLAIEFDAGRVTEVIVLLKLASEADWFQPLHERGGIQCQIRKRLHFDGAKNGATFPSVAVYLGKHPARFAAAFHDRGAIYQPMNGWNRVIGSPGIGGPR